MGSLLKKVSFIIAILGIFYLSCLLILPPSEFVDLNKELINEKISLKGVVEAERNYGDFKILTVSGLDVTCACEESYLEKQVEVEGLISEFNGQRQIKALKITVLQ